MFHEVCRQLGKPDFITTLGCLHLDCPYHQCMVQDVDRRCRYEYTEACVM